MKQQRRSTDWDTRLSKNIFMLYGLMIITCVNFATGIGGFCAKEDFGTVRKAESALIDIIKSPEGPSKIAKGSVYVIGTPGRLVGYWANSAYHYVNDSNRKIIID